ncbi:uncharacterized protein LOC105773374 isoform X1 [Gossypium raimondii]|uniref:uncharacterized protein LOC105773374 isoform X1 n=1 Tax=Gossypium raimondii TaxID=29730 RepID=UPI00227A6554|nr:uncharacterized protein LOC105773374 isoform X1 [Gossypium raimondii]
MIYTAKRDSKRFTDQTANRTATKIQAICYRRLAKRGRRSPHHVLTPCSLSISVESSSYQHTKYHNQTKNQWARDDPAFVVICSLLLAVATVAYCAAYDHSAAHAVSVVITVSLFHFLLAGILLATCCWFLTNAYLRKEAPNTCVVEQRVEWLYAFDLHCNSFFPMFVMLYVIHYFLSPLLVAHGFISALLSNLLFMVAASYHHYLNFLGYDVLPFLKRTTFFLYPIGIVIILSPICKFQHAIFFFYSFLSVLQ